MSLESRPAQRLRRRSLALVALIGCLSMNLSATDATAQGGLPTPPPGDFAPNGPPPVPEYWYTGSEADNIPAGGTVVLFTHPDVVLTHPYSYGVFRLKGPQPLQTKHSVACGDLGCVYNHLDWSVFSGDVVSGCGTNSSTCDVEVPPQATGWTAVMVRQNTEPPLIFLLWNSLVPGGTIRGTVTDATGAGVPGVDVNGAATDYAGFYTTDVAAGTYTVSASGPGGPYVPASRRVTVPRGGAVEADFTAKSYEVGGLVQGKQCGEGSCSPPQGVGGVPVLVTGTTTNGKAVKATAVSKAGTGKWSLRLAAGRYTTGPTLDGKTFAGPVFTPATRPVVLAKGPSWGNDFLARLQGPGSGPGTGGVTEGPMLPAVRVAARTSP